jgi:Mg-chelatase subunit ChlD
MNPQCSQCRQINPPQSRYCGGCGALLGATIHNSRTVVAPTRALAARHFSPAGPKSAATDPGKTHIQDRTRSRRMLDQITDIFGPKPASVDHFDNGRSQNPQREHTFLVLDISTSMRERYDHRLTKLQAAQRAGISLVLEKHRIDPQDYIGLIRFTDTAKVVIDLSPLSSHKQRIIDAIQSLTAGGNTDIETGLLLSKKRFTWNDRQVVRRIVLLTDGHGGNPLATANELKSNGVVIHVIGIGETPETVDESLLRQIASTVDGRIDYHFAKDSQTLIRQFTHLAGKTRIAPF